MSRDTSCQRRWNTSFSKMPDVLIMFTIFFCKKNISELDFRTTLPYDFFFLLHYWTVLQQILMTLDNSSSVVQSVLPANWGTLGLCTSLRRLNILTVKVRRWKWLMLRRLFPEIFVCFIVNVSIYHFIFH